MIAGELASYSADLAARPRWLVVNKLDLLPADERPQRVTEIVAALAWQAPSFGISAATGEGTATLARAVMTYLESAAPRAAESE